MSRKTIFIFLAGLLFSSCFFSSTNKADDNVKLIPVVTDDRGDFASDVFVRVNQVGFRRLDVKTAVVLSKKDMGGVKFYIKDVKSGKDVFESRIQPSIAGWGGFNFCHVIDFTGFGSEGTFVIDVDGSRSSNFKIGEGIYNTIVDSLLLFFKVQRCGPTGPYLHKVCHLYDSPNVVGDDRAGKTDVTGGWHDAGDFTKFLNTTAFSTYMLLFAYEFNSKKMEFDKNKDGAPDVLEEARVGLDLLLRMNYKPNNLIIQVQDKRDQTVGWRMPENDTLKFDRPAFAGMGKNLIGIYTAALAMGSRIWKTRFQDAAFSDKLMKAANNIFALRNSAPDVDTNPIGLYQDSKYEGKLALGAIEMYISTGIASYLEEAKTLAKKADSDYWWSWGNINSLAQYRVAKYSSNMKQYIENNLSAFNDTRKKTPFGEGTSFSWGTTHTLLGIAMQSILFRDLTKSSLYDSVASYQRDYVLGKNPWGVSFIYNIGSRFTRNFHSQVGYFNKGYLPGAVAAGPVPAEILKGYNIQRTNSTYDKFNSPEVKYYDDRQDYITNEPTIVTNATAVFVFSHFYK
ncbi:MAG: glycoside hydrolase family 9 protein [Bacteroidetes bacterium]|nr:glycoside hydrolase family 9 protein [Bacteroidota bacterium]